MRGLVTILVLSGGLGLPIAWAGDEDDCRKGAFDLRIAACNRIIDSGQLRPDALADMLHQRGRAKRDVGDTAGAIDDYNRALVIQPRPQGLYQDRARAKRELGDLDGAIADLTRVIELDPRDSSNYARRGDVKRIKRDVEGAFADAERAMDLNPKNPAAHNLHGNLSYSKADFGAAAISFARASELNPKNVSYLHNLGDAMRGMGNPNGALQAYERALAIDPRYAYSYFIRGIAKREGGDYEGTIADMNRTLELDPGYRDAMAVRATAHYLSGRFSQAATDLRHAHEIGANWYNLALMHLAESRSGGGDALKLIGRMYRPGDTRWPNSMLGLYLGKADEVAARASAEHAVPGTRAIQRCAADFLIGNRQLIKGERNKALASLRDARASCPKTSFSGTAAIAELRRLGE